MKVAIMSDSHDNLWNLRTAVKMVQDMGISEIIHLGDLISPFMLEEVEGFEGTFHLIYGNNNGDHILLQKKIAALGGLVQFHGWLGELEFDSKKIGFIHDPLLARKIAKSGDYDVVLFGHTHLWLEEQVGKCLLLNPGEILGKKEAPGFAVLECSTLEVERVQIGPKRD
ncbi:MAG: YfcE family phosphodiesterase [Thermodesulfobacteria bacterium]|nr:YfcE family phosphodiesterase [Thermodesulfobacteriota bacterium]